MKKLESEVISFFDKNSSESSKEISCNSLGRSNCNSFECESNPVDIIFSDVDPKYSDKIPVINHLTSQIRSIQKQGVLLIGEKIYKVREILKEIGCLETSFTKWVSFVFPTKSSAYNALAYYELYKSLPTDSLKRKFQKIPFKAAYMLASRKVDLRKKISVVHLIQDMKNDSAIEVLNQEIPSSKAVGESLSERNSLDFLVYRKVCELIFLVKKDPDISSETREALKKLVSLLKKCSSSVKS